MNRKDIDLINESFLKVLEQTGDDGDGSSIDKEIQEKLSKLGKLISEPKYNKLGQNLRESVFVDYDGKELLRFYTNTDDKLHNTEGPAVVFASGNEHYYVNGKEASEDDIFAMKSASKMTTRRRERGDTDTEAETDINELFT
jgi:hypothetical protein